MTTHVDFEEADTMTVKCLASVSRCRHGRCGVPLRSRLLMMGAAMLAMATAYALLALSAAPPLGGMLILGVAYSVVNVGYWASIPMVLEQHQLSAAAGVVGATMNVLPGEPPRHHLALHDNFPVVQGCLWYSIATLRPLLPTLRQLTADCVWGTAFVF
jgi:hypothetical protein